MSKVHFDEEELTKETWAKVFDILEDHAKRRDTFCDINEIIPWLKEEREIFCNEEGE